MNFLKKISLLFFLILSFSAISLASSYPDPDEPCEKEETDCAGKCPDDAPNAIFDWRNFINVYLPTTEMVNDDHSFMNIMLPEDLQSVVDEESIQFRNSPKSIRPKLKLSKHKGIDNRRFTWKKGMKELVYGNMKIMVDSDANPNVSEKFGFKKISSGDENLKTLNIKVLNNKTGTLLRTYTLTGGSKSDSDSEKYLEKSPDGKNYVYEVNVYAEIFYAGGSKKRHMKIWKNYDASGEPADNFYHYIYGKKPATLEVWSEPYAVKNTGLPDTTFEKKRMKFTSANTVRDYENLIYTRYETITSSDGKTSLGKKLKTGSLRLRLTTFNFKNGKTVENQDGEDFKKTYVLDQNHKVKSAIGKCSRVFRSAEDWSVFEYEDNADGGFIETEYTPKKEKKGKKFLASKIKQGAKVKSISSLENIPDTEVVAIRREYKPTENVISDGKKVENKIVKEEIYEALGNFSSENIKVQNLKLISTIEHSANDNSKAGGIAKLQQQTLSTGELTKNVASKSSEDIAMLSGAPLSAPVANVERAVFEGETQNSTLVVNSFVDSSGIPNYSSIPYLSEGGAREYNIKYSLTGVASDTSSGMLYFPWDTSSPQNLSNINLVSGKSILKVEVYNLEWIDMSENEYIEGPLAYTAEYVYIFDENEGMGVFHPISWTYYTYNGHGNQTGAYHQNGLYSTIEYGGYPSETRPIYIYTTITCDQNGIETERGYSDPERKKQLYERKIGAHSNAYNMTFNDILTINSGDLSGFAACGSCASAIEETGDSLMSYYNAGEIQNYGESIENATLLYQTYRYKDEHGNTTIDIDSYGLRSDYTYSTNQSTGETTITEIRPGYNSTDDIYKQTILDVDGRTLSVTGKGVVDQFYTYNDTPLFGVRSEIVHYGTPDSARFTTNYYDENDRVIRTETPLEISTNTYSDEGNLLETSSRASGSSENSGTRTIYSYDIMGNSTNVVRQNYNETTQEWETLSQSSSETSYAFDNNLLWKISSSDNFTSKERVGNSYEIEDGYLVLSHSISLGEGMKSESKTLVNRDGKISKSKFSLWLGSVDALNQVSTQENISFNGNEIEYREYDSSGTLQSKKLSYYDAYGRLASEDNFTGASELLHTTKFFYNNGSTIAINAQANISTQGFIKGVSIVKQGSVIGRKAEYYGVNEKNSGQLKKLTQATTFNPSTHEPLSGNALMYNYNDLGNVTRMWGFGQIPSEFAYNTYGQMTDMYLYKLPPSQMTKWNADTWPSDINNTNANVERTQWAYDALGKLTSKTDALNKIQTASYDNVSGLLSSMSFADGANFAYSYDSKWRTVAETYNDGSISYTYDDSSNIAQAVQTLADNSTQTYSYTYGEYSTLPTQETLPDGWKLLRTMDCIGNLTSLTLKDNNGIVKYAVSYTYDANFQMSSLRASGKTISYTRNDNNFITNISLNNLANISYAYDNLGRLQSMSYNSNNNELLKNSYEIGTDENIASTTVSKNGEVYGQWRYTYENLSSGLKTANFYKSASSNELVDEYSSYTYTYDTAGNPYSESKDGASTVSYTSSLNNQTTNITRSSNLKYPIRGKKSANSSLAINGIPQNTTDETFCYGLPAYKATPKYEEIKIEASQNSSTQKSMERGRAYLPESSESLTYSNIGNLTSDSRWVYTWNARQRLAEIETSTQAINAGVPKVKYVYSYNWKGLKTKSEKYTWNADSNAWSLYSTNHRYYDEHNLIYERTEYAENVKDLYGQQMQPTYNKYYYGLDLLNYLHGTGGTGGVRMVNINGTDAFTYNNIVGNIEALYDATTGEILLAEYEYAPFGEIRKQGGTLANTNPLRFSSRYLENETNLSYYSYRHYSPETKKWLSKDPIAEDGGLNLYNFVANKPAIYFDSLGLVVEGDACCGTTKYNAKTQCCIDNKDVYSKKERIKTGLSLVYLYTRDIGLISNELQHAWIEYDFGGGSTSAGFHPAYDVSNFFGYLKYALDIPIPGQVVQPERDEYTNWDNRSSEEKEKDRRNTARIDVSLYPCIINIKAFQTCISDVVAKNKINPPTYSRTFNCAGWVKRIALDCMEKSKQKY